MNGREPPAPAARTYLVYDDNGLRLVYAGDDLDVCERVCTELAARSAGYVSGYQFVGRERIELRAFFEPAPSEAFLAVRLKRDLFDFAWHSSGQSEVGGKGADHGGA